MPIFLHAKSCGYAAYSPQSLQIESLERLFSTLGDTVTRIPPQDRWDFFYSLAETKTPRKKDAKDAVKGTWVRENWVKQEALAFDIDGMKHEDARRVEEYTDVVAKILNCEPDQLTVVASGHGLHFIFFLSVPITDASYFEKNKKLYSLVCEELDAALAAGGLSGKADRAVFDHARILRLPDTENRKREPYRECRLLQLSLFRHSVDWAGLLGMESLAEDEEVKTHEMGTTYRNLDVPAILGGCAFLEHVRDEPGAVKEPQGYAALSLLARMGTEAKTGRELAKEWMKTWTGSTSLSSCDPDRKIDQAVTASNPRTCKSIGTLWPGCSGCKYFGQVNSPLGIKGPSFIASEPDHFYWLERDEATGKVKKRIPQYADLVKAFVRDHEYFYADQAKQLWVFSGVFYEPVTDAFVKNYAERHFKPEPTESMRAEFLAKVKANRLKAGDDADTFFKESVRGKVNLANGVFDIKTRTLVPHDSGYGFRYVLPYAYDPLATAPRFDQFLDEIMLGRAEYKDALLDALAGLLVPYQAVGEVFWWFQGVGANGKTTLLDLAKGVVGTKNVVYLSPNALKGDAGRFKLAELDGKLLCLIEEVNETRLEMDFLGQLKNLSGGGTITAERKGKDPFQMTNQAKIWFTANNSPVLADTSEAVKRRFLPVPFELNLEEDGCKVAMDGSIKDKLKAELPGIFNKILLALDALLARGKALRTEGGKAIFRKLVLDSDSVERWMEDRLLRDVPMENRIAFKSLYLDYTNSLEDDEERYKVNRITFSKRLADKLGQRGKAKPMRVKGYEGTVNGYEGLALREGPPSREF